MAKVKLDALVSANQTIARGKRKLNEALKASKRGETKARRQFGDLLKELVIDENGDLQPNLAPGLTEEERIKIRAESTRRIQNRVTGYLLSYREATEKDRRAWDVAGERYWKQADEDAQRVREPYEITYPVPEHALAATELELRYRGWYRTSKHENRWEGSDDYDSAVRLASVHGGKLRRLGVVMLDETEVMVALEPEANPSASFPVISGARNAAD